MKFEDSIKTVIKHHLGISETDIILEKTTPDEKYPDVVIIKSVESIDKDSLMELLPTCIERIV